MSATPKSERILRSQIAASTRWGMTADRSAATAPARQGLMRKFEQQADPDGTLPPAEREYRANQLMKAHMLRMSLAAKKARRAKAAERRRDLQLGSAAQGGAE